MAKIENAKGRNPTTGPSGYERLLGNARLGRLISRCQATVISSGNELETFLERKVKNPEGISIGNLNKDERIFKNIKTDSDGKRHAIGVDVVIKKDGRTLLIELKDGDVFDVKKIAGEVESLQLVKKHLADIGQSPESRTSIHFCSFNQEEKEPIYKGAKGLIPKGSAMTGPELCDLLGVDYVAAVSERRLEQPANLEYFLRELIDIPEIRSRLKQLLE